MGTERDPGVVATRPAREPVLTTKLFIPPVRANFVSRPRLLERLDATLAVSLLLVSAPAGFGKTTLLAEWLARKAKGAEQERFAWLSLDPSDNDPVRFLTYVIAALQTARPGIGTAALDWLQSPQPPPVETVLAALINDLCGLAGHTVLIFDDYHVIEDARVNEAVSYLVHRLPEHVHLVMATRVDPPLPLARWRSRSSLAEIRSDDLRFTDDEAALFLSQTMGCNLSAADVAALANRTEGWAVGLQMAALSVRGRPAGGEAPGSVARFIEAFGGTHRYILDYLVEEVLERQAESTQNFLLQTSILDRLSGPLCDAVTGGSDGQTVLEGLERANLFLVPLDDRREWYRYHHLFADLLRGRLRQTDGGLCSALHGRASDWFAARGLLAEAARHALAAGDDDRLAQLIETHALAMLDFGELPTLARWLDAVDRRVLETRPWLCVARGWVEVYTSELDAIEPVLQHAEAALERQASPDMPQVRGHIAAIRSYVASQQGDKARSAELARAALACLPEKDLMARGLAAGRLAHALRWMGDLAGADEALATGIAISRASGHSHVEVDVTCDLGGLRMAQGRLHDAAAIFEDVLRRADQASQPGLPRSPMLATACINLGWVRREWNDLQVAARYDLEGLALAEQWGQKDVLRSGYYEAIRLYRALGDVEAGRTMVQKVCDLTRGMSPWLYSIARAEEALFHLRHGDLGAASAWAQTCGLTPCDQPVFRCLGLYVALARVLAAQDCPEQELALLARCFALTQKAGAAAQSIEILLLQALAWATQDREARGREALTKALALARPECFMRTFVDEGEPARRLIASYVAHAQEGEPTGAVRPEVTYARQLLASFPVPGAPGAGRVPARPAFPDSGNAGLPLVEELTARELEVLQHMAAGLSNLEIAGKLYLAEGTVKTHTHSIFGKLGVRSRTQAIRRARELGLL